MADRTKNRSASARPVFVGKATGCLGSRRNRWAIWSRGHFQKNQNPPGDRSSQPCSSVGSALDKHPALPSRRASAAQPGGNVSARATRFRIRSPAGPPMKIDRGGTSPKGMWGWQVETPRPRCGQEQHCEGYEPQERGRQRQAAAKPWKLATGSGTSSEIDQSAMHDLSRAALATD